MSCIDTVVLVKLTVSAVKWPYVARNHCSNVNRCATCRLQAYRHSTSCSIACSRPNDRVNAYSLDRIYSLE